VNGVMLISAITASSVAIAVVVMHVGRALRREGSSPRR
jgi:hypothetical protein